MALASGEMLRADRVILATGGLSVPATGSDGMGLRIAAGLGHTLVAPYPALTPLIGSRPDHGALAGISLTAIVTAISPRDRRPLHSRGGFLFTHRGYSGPAVLNVAHVVTRPPASGGEPPPLLTVQWADDDAETWDARLIAGRGPVLALLRQSLPERLAALLLGELGLTGADLSQLRREERGRLVAALTRYPLPWLGHEGYRVAEVTGGGVALSEVDPGTLSSQRQPGLYLCGEMLDAFGPIGGYNFLWAWVTGRTAGLGCAV